MNERSRAVSPVLNESIATTLNFLAYINYQVIFIIITFLKSILFFAITVCDHFLNVNVKFGSFKLDLLQLKFSLRFLLNLSRSSCLARLRILTVERLCNGFDSDAELFMHICTEPNKCINYNNAFCKQFNKNEHFSSFEFSSAEIKIGI